MTANRTKCRIRSGLRQLTIATAIVVAASVISTASFALGTPEQRAACTSDVIRLCMSSVGSDSRLIACITKNKSNLSERCRTTLTRKPG